MTRRTGTLAVVALASALAACAPSGPQPAGEDSMRSLTEGFVQSTLGDGSIATRLQLYAVDLDRVPEGTDLTQTFTERRFFVPMLISNTFDPGWEFSDASALVTDGGGLFFNANTLVRGPFAAEDLAAPAEPVSDGIWTYGEGEDFAINMDGNRDLDGLGRPVRVGQTDAELFYSLSTRQVEQWLEGTGTLGENESVMAVVDRLDEADAFSIRLAVATDPLAPIMQSTQPDREELLVAADQLVLVREACEYIGVGYSEADGEIVTHVVYQFGTPERAEDAVAGVESAWRDGFNAQAVPVGDLIDDVTSVEQQDSLVVVALDAGENGAWVAEGINQAPLACAGANG